MQIRVAAFGATFCFEVFPTDTVWSLKWKIYHNEDIRKLHFDHNRVALPGPDSIDLFAHYQNDVECLTICERSLESCSISETTMIHCQYCHPSKQENAFKGLLSSFRKKDIDKATNWSLIEVAPISWRKHCIHIHEVRSIIMTNARTEDQKGRHVMERIHSMFHSTPYLKKLTISSHEEIEDGIWIRIAKCLEMSVSLKELDLCTCGIGQTGYARIWEVLRKNTSLVFVNISRTTGIGDEIVAETGEIAEALEKNSSLRKICLRGFGVETSDHFRMDHMLKTNSTLVIMDLRRNCKIGDAGCIQIAEGLENNHSLKELHLSLCGIGAKGAIRIGRMLEKNSSLVILNLRDNYRIGDEGWSQIAKGLEVNTSLKKLDIEECGIRIIGAIKIGQMLEANSSLLSLDLSRNNSIGDEGATRISEGLKKNHSLLNLQMDKCGIRSRPLLTGFRSLLRRNRLRKTSECHSIQVRRDGYGDDVQMT
eukprot:TRINITY_DN4279_c0_g1_i11.p1 TRINITY_DN4279_c0_g1~~TRINITY_DN4279_c0_g1_i11.p1  ORF type:complete len:506 (-),score=82.38 TRINITY_DN4279_c0_g1_i11:684-2123(-)